MVGAIRERLFNTVQENKTQEKEFGREENPNTQLRGWDYRLVCDTLLSAIVGEGLDKFLHPSTNQAQPCLASEIDKFLRKESVKLRKSFSKGLTRQA